VTLRLNADLADSIGAPAASFTIDTNTSRY